MTSDARQESSDAKRRGRKKGSENRKNSKRQLAAAAKKKEIIDLRISGYGVAEIADSVNLSQSRTYAIIQEAIAELPQESAQMLRVIQSEQLAAMMASVMQSAAQGDTRAIETVLRIQERQARLHGMDAPQKLAVGGDPGAPAVQHVDKIIVEYV